MLFSLLVMTGMVSPDPTMCRVLPFPLARGSDVTYAVAEAQSDTVRAGPGTVEPIDLPPHWHGPDREIFGQVLHVDQYGGADSLALSQAFARSGSSEVIAVPWSYDPSCGPQVWEGTALWTLPGTVGFYKLVLRAQLDWVDETPTFDVFHADREPFPHGPRFQRLYAEELGDHALPPEDYLEIYRRMPTFEIKRSRVEFETAMEDLERWISEHPEVANRFPASEILAYLRRYRPPGD